MLRKFGAFFSLLVLLGGTIYLLQQWRLFQRIPKNYEWNSLQAYLSTQAYENDLILFEPSWLVGYAQVHGRLTQFSVVTGRELFKNFYPPSSKLWLISLLRNSPLAEHLEKSGFIPEGPQSIHSIFLIPFRIPQRNVLYDFNQNLPKASAFFDYGDGRIAEGMWKDNAWIFPQFPDSEWWHKVAITPTNFRRQGTRRCIWFHPLETAVKKLEYREVPLGNRIELFGGIADSGVRMPPGGPVYLSIQINGEKVATLEFRDTDSTFQHLVETSSFSGKTARVTFQVQTSEQAWRHFCFSAWSES